MKRRLFALLRVFCGASAVLVCAVRAEAASCSVSTTSVAFGTYDVFSSSPADTTGSVSFTCNGAASIEIRLDKGVGSGANFSRRRLTGPASDTLNYNLYLDASRSTIWGDGTGSTSKYTNANPPINTPVVVTIYGRISAGQDVSTGAYTDSVTVTINF